MSADVGELKRQQREMWATGDYPAVAEKIAAAGRDIVEAAEIGPGMDVLDVAAGAGNAAIPAALAGGKVTASDLTPELFEAGRQNAARAGVELDWVEADAESLPFEDSSFDRVLSTFGAMFAPDHRRTADELVRVCRPGGVVAMANWTPAGAAGGMFAVLGSHLPPPPDAPPPPPLWGTEEHVRELFGPAGLELRLEPRTVTVRDLTGEGYVDYLGEKFGPMIGARATLQADGRWEAVRRELAGVFEASSTPEGDGFEMEYLLVLGRKPG